MFARVDGEDFMASLESEFPFYAPKSVANTLTKLTLRVPKIRMLADSLFSEKRSESTTGAILQLIECCQHLDTALSTWRETTPEDWQYTSQPNFTSVLFDFSPETSEVYPGNVDVYPDVWIAKAWNSYRTTRIFVQAMILRSAAWLAGGDMQDPRLISQIAGALQARQVIQEMVDEICASVPFHLGQTTKLGDKAYTNVINGQEDQATEYFGGYFLLWPLYLARCPCIIPNEQRRWIIARIFSIARQIGIEEDLVWRKLNEPPAQLLF